MPTKSDKQMLNVPEFEQLQNLLSGDQNGKGGISDSELLHLCWLAAQVPAGGVIVEIGSHRGKSTCALGCGLRAEKNVTGKIFAIDLWTLGKGKTFGHYNSLETWRIFNEQVAALGLANVVQARMMSSADAAAKRTKPIDLLFIDASHKYKDVKQDYDLWSKFVPAGGYIAFHDYGTRFKGVNQTVAEALASGLWVDVRVHDRIWSARRTA